MNSDLEVGDKLLITKDIYDDGGRAYFTPGYIAIKNSIVIVRQITNVNIKVSHQNRFDDYFCLYSNEYVKINDYQHLNILIAKFKLDNGKHPTKLILDRVTYERILKEFHISLIQIDNYLETPNKEKISGLVVYITDEKDECMEVS